MSNWHRLLDRAIRGLQSLPHVKITEQDWTLGGGTALMLQLQHRMSKDIDIFFHDAQYLTFLSPRLGGESIWGADAYDEAGHYLKLRYPEGEIDFIVSRAITDIEPHQTADKGIIQQLCRSLAKWRRLPSSPHPRHKGEDEGAWGVALVKQASSGFVSSLRTGFSVDGNMQDAIPPYAVSIEHPVEIALKKALAPRTGTEDQRRFRHSGCSRASRLAFAIQSAPR